MFVLSKIGTNLSKQSQIFYLSKFFSSKNVYRSFSMKMVLFCFHVWSVDLFLVTDRAPGRKLVKRIYFVIWQCSNCSCLGLLSFRQNGVLCHVWYLLLANVGSMELFFSQSHPNHQQDFFIWNKNISSCYIFERAHDRNTCLRKTVGSLEQHKFPVPCSMFLVEVRQHCGGHMDDVFFHLYFSLLTCCISFPFHASAPWIQRIHTFLQGISVYDKPTCWCSPLGVM